MLAVWPSWGARRARQQTPPGETYRLGMTETLAGKTQDEDVISLVADVGEEVLRGFSVLLFSLPRRIVAGTLDGVGDVLHGAAAMLGEVDPVDTRVTELEKRLDSLEKATGTRGTAPTRTKRAKRRAEHEATEATKPTSEGEHAQ
jgi:hypothetical protein